MAAFITTFASLLLGALVGAGVAMLVEMLFRRWGRQIMSGGWRVVLAIALVVLGAIAGAARIDPATDSSDERLPDLTARVSSFDATLCQFAIIIENSGGDAHRVIGDMAISDASEAVVVTQAIDIPFILGDSAHELRVNAPCGRLDQRWKVDLVVSSDDVGSRALRFASDWFDGLKGPFTIEIRIHDTCGGSQMSYEMTFMNKESSPTPATRVELRLFSGPANSQAISSAEMLVPSLAPGERYVASTCVSVVADWPNYEVLGRVEIPGRGTQETESGLYYPRGGYQG